MPTYLCHGFKWERQALRGWIVLHDVEDASPDWLVAPDSRDALLSTFARDYPYIPFGPAWFRDADEERPEKEDEAEGWYSPVHLLEEYSATVETNEPGRPFTYVADHVVKVDFGVDITKEMRRYGELEKVGEGTADGWWFERFRTGLSLFGNDTLDMGWHVVVCDDEERAFEDSDEEDEVEETEQEEKTENIGAKAERRVEGEKNESVQQEPGKTPDGSGKEERKKSLKSGLKGLLPIRKKPKA